jgi:hypothetical protein
MNFPLPNRNKSMPEVKQWTYGDDRHGFAYGEYTPAIKHAPTTPDAETVRMPAPEVDREAITARMPAASPHIHPITAALWLCLGMVTAAAVLVIGWNYFHPVVAP